MRALNTASWQGLSEEASSCEQACTVSPILQPHNKTRNPKLDFSCEHCAASGKQQTRGDKLLAKAAAAVENTTGII